MKEFFGIGGYQREPEGYLSWQHLVFVSSLMVVMALLAVFFGRRYRNRSPKEKNKVLVVTAIVIDALEVFYVTFLSIRDADPWLWRLNLPLFLCSIMLIALPLAAFSQGRLKEAALDFVVIFGLLAAVMGTYGAGQNYGTYPVLSVTNVVSGLEHAISGFASLYILVSGMASMKKKNIVITFAILTGFCVAAYIADLLIPYNYMFLIRGDGTPYDILYNLVNGNQVLYPILVVVLFLAYIAAFYGVYYLVTGKRKKA